MKNQAQLVIIVALSILTGCLGTLVFESTRATAQTRGFTRCFSADFSDLADGDNPDHMRRGHGGISVEGWTPVGGADRGVILCR